MKDKKTIVAIMAKDGVLQNPNEELPVSILYKDENGAYSMDVMPTLNKTLDEILEELEDIEDGADKSE